MGVGLQNTHRPQHVRMLLTGRENIGDGEDFPTELLLPVQLRRWQRLGRVVQVYQRVLEVQHQVVRRVQHLPGYRRARLGDVVP